MTRRCREAATADASALLFPFPGQGAFCRNPSPICRALLARRGLAIDRYAVEKVGSVGCGRGRDLGATIFPWHTSRCSSPAGVAMGHGTVRASRGTARGAGGAPTPCARCARRVGITHACANIKRCAKERTCRGLSAHPLLPLTQPWAWGSRHVSALFACPCDYHCTNDA